MILERPASLRGHLCVLGERCALWAPGQLDRHNPRQSLPLLSLHITPRSTSDYPSSHGGTCLHPSHTPALLKECRHRSHRHSPPSPPSPPWFPWTRTLPIYRRSHLVCLRVPPSGPQDFCMTLLVKIPLSIVRATLSGLKIPASEAPPTTPKMSTNNRQNVTWVEVRPVPSLLLRTAHTLTDLCRVFVE
jgi:hypothetical protein